MLKHAELDNLALEPIQLAFDCVVVVCVGLANIAKPTDLLDCGTANVPPMKDIKCLLISSMLPMRLGLLPCEPANSPLRNRLARHPGHQKIDVLLWLWHFLFDPACGIAPGLKPW